MIFLLHFPLKCTHRTVTASNSKPSVRCVCTVCTVLMRISLVLRTRVKNIGVYSGYLAPPCWEWYIAPLKFFLENEFNTRYHRCHTPSLAPRTLLLRLVGEKRASKNVGRTPFLFRLLAGYNKLHSRPPYSLRFWTCTALVNRCNPLLSSIFLSHSQYNLCVCNTIESIELFGSKHAIH